jgi:hypothetical protein
MTKVEGLFRQVHTCPDPARVIFGSLSGYDIGSVEERTRGCVPVPCSITSLVKQAYGVSASAETGVQTDIIVKATITYESRGSS